MSNLARAFHDSYEKLAPSFGYQTRTDTKEFDPDSPNGKLMIAVCAPIAEELDFLLHFLQEADFGPADSQVRDIIFQEWKDYTQKDKLPGGYYFSDGETQ